MEKTPSAPAAPATSPAKAAVSAKDDPMSAKLGGKQDLYVLGAHSKWGQ